MLRQKISREEKEGLAREAMGRAIQARLEAGLEEDAPICAYSAAEQLGAPVRFVDIDMEGMYRREPSPRILVSAHRPLTRRHFTCAHEIGHHVFGHGTTLDESQERMAETRERDPEELLADAFAAHFLMPVLGIRYAFARRGTSPSEATPAQVLAVAGEFGVGYESLVTQLAISFRDITDARRRSLLAARKALRSSMVPEGMAGPIVLIDRFFRAATLDVEINHIVVGPHGSVSDDDSLVFVCTSDLGNVYRAMRRGLAELAVSHSSWGAAVRITKEKFVGLARFRFLGDE